MEIVPTVKNAISAGAVRGLDGSPRSSRALAWYTLLLVILTSWSMVSQANQSPSRLIIGGDVSYPPYEWLDNGAPRGLNVDLLDQVARLGGSSTEVRLGTWPDPLSALRRGDVDIVALFPTAERSSDFLFTAPFYYVNHAIYAAPRVLPVHNLEDLTGQRVAVEERSPMVQQLQREQIRVRLIYTDDVTMALRALINDDAEYAILPTPTADRLIHQLGMPVEKVVPSVGSAALAFAVHHSRPDLFAWLQHNLERSVRTGRFAAVQQQWQREMEFKPPLDLRQVSLIVLGVIAGLLLVVIAIMLWAWRLMHRIRLHTRELKQAQAAESKARHLANYDSTTDLPKEHEFVRQLDQLLSSRSRNQAQELRLIKLTALNEMIKVLGREYAEQLIRRFADSIRQFSQGNPCGYLGRGVYAMCHEAQTMPRVFDTLLNYWSREDERIHSQIVGGSAYWPQDGQTGLDLVQCAETALSASRSHGKRWMAYSPDMEPEADELEMVSQFRANELEGLTAVYQPQIDLSAGRAVSAETLARWSHPIFGSVAPYRFIPMLEKAGLITQLTGRMLDKAAQMSASLRAEGLPSVISVNITISDLMENDFPRLVEETLKRHGARASDLKLELTETSVANDLKSATDVLHRLHDSGVALSVDDFGTGYSSLSYLSAFPIHEVKIDRHFVFDMVRNPRNRSIVRSTIMMARELGLQTVAEGAEDRATLELLAEYHCDRVQGYVFSPPLDEAAFREFMRKHKDGGLL